MQTKLTLKPGQNGAKKWLKTYGKKLINVRYRYDHKAGKRYTTIEIIVDERTWPADNHVPKTTHAATDLPGIRVAGYAQAEKVGSDETI